MLRTIKLKIDGEKLKKKLQIKDGEDGKSVEGPPGKDAPNEFIKLKDTPNSYIGQEGKLVAVSRDAKGLVFTRIELKEPTGDGLGRTAIGDRVIGGLEGSVLFIDDNEDLAENNDNFFWSDTTNANFLRLGSGTSGGEIRLLEGSAGGTNYTGWKAPETLAANVLYTLPTADGSNGQLLSTDGAGTLSWAASGTDVTLSVNLDTNLLSITGQELGLDTQSPNEVFAGPTSGAVAAPAFRTLVDADIPNTITLDNITQITTRSHASLQGLTADDHTQYSLVNGTREFTGTVGGINPVADTDLTTKDYVDTFVQGLEIKSPCRLGTTANITLSGEQTIDGVSAVAGNRVLVKDQTAAEENGIYVVASGAWSRSTDADTDDEVNPGMFTLVTAGNTLTATGWALVTPEPITLGTTELEFSQISSPTELSFTNSGTGSGVLRDVVGDTVTFRRLNASSARITITEDTNDIDFNVPIGGSNGQIQFNNSNAFGADSNLFWNNTEKALGVGTNTPEAGSRIHIVNSSAGARFLIDTAASGNVSSNFQLREVGDEVNQRTIFARNISSHSTVPNSFDVDHWAAGSRVSLIRMSGGGNISYLSSGGAVYSDLSDATLVAVASAQLEVVSTTKGFLPPRMTTTQRNAISSPATGLMVYNTSTNKINFFNGTGWEVVTST